MKIICAPQDFAFNSRPDALGVVLYGHGDRQQLGSAGAAVLDAVKRQRFHPAPRAWDFLSIALSVMAADLAGHLLDEEKSRCLAILQRRSVAFHGSDPASLTTT